MVVGFANRCKLDVKEDYRISHATLRPRISSVHLVERLENKVGKTNILGPFSVERIASLLIQSRVVLRSG